MENFLKQHSGKKEVGEYTLKFSKHKGRTFRDVYENEKAWVAWALQTLDKGKDGVVLDYFRSKIETDYHEPVKKKKEKC